MFTDNYYLLLKIPKRYILNLQTYTFNEMQAYMLALENLHFSVFLLYTVCTYTYTI